MATILAESKSARILVLGETDRGKSTFCKLFSRELVMRGHPVSYLDSDIGQKDIGPPATITLGRIDEVGFEKATLAGMYFVGSVSPTGHFLPMVVGTRLLADSVKTQFTLINTPGFVSGSGKVLTCYQIESLRPDVIVAIEENGELESILQEYPFFRVIRIKPAIAARAKSVLTRTDVRNNALKKYLEHAKRVRIGVEKVVLQHLDRDKILNRYCGVADQRGDCLGVAIIEEASRRSYVLLTPVRKEGIRVIQLGSLWMSQDMQLLNGSSHP